MAKVGNLMNVLVIANGFDLFHGMKTTFWDLKMFIENEDTDVRSIIEECLKTISDDSILKTHLEENKNTWTKEWIEKQTNDFDKAENIFWSDIEVSLGNRITENTDSIQKNALTLTFMLSLLLEYYLIHKVITLEIQKDEKMEKYLSKFDVIYCFNYTPTVEKIYGISNEKIVYIHGKLGREKKDIKIQYGTIILGCDTEGYPNLPSKIGTELSNLKERPIIENLNKCDMNIIKYDNSDESNIHTEQYKNVIESLKNHFEYINIDFNTMGNNIKAGQIDKIPQNKRCNIEIFGHSFGKSDKRFIDIIKRGIENKEPVRLGSSGHVCRVKIKSPRLKVSYFTENKEKGKMPSNIQTYLEGIGLETEDIRSILVPINEILK